MWSVSLLTVLSVGAVSGPAGSTQKHRGSFLHGPPQEALPETLEETPAHSVTDGPTPVLQKGKEW